MNNPNCLKILVIDDEPSVLSMLRQLLALGGYDVDTSSSGKEGLERIKSGNYDVVITDIQMPGLSGKEVAIIAKTLKGKRLPVIGLSGTPWLLDNTLFDVCLSKPCCKKELFDAVAKAVFPR